jgi:hypothetical protein
MADKYTTDLDRTGNVVGVGTVTNPASVPFRIKVYEAFVSLNGGTPTDAYREWQLTRVTVVATGTTVTPRPIDAAAPAALALALDVITAEGTETDIVSTRSVHERASYTWVFYPGTEIVIPATASNGIKVRQSSASATVAKGNINFEE